MSRLLTSINKIIYQDRYQDHLLTLITKPFFRLGNFHFLLVRQNLGRLKVGHELEPIGAACGGSECQEENASRTALHHLCTSSGIERREI